MEPKLKAKIRRLLKDDIFFQNPFGQMVVGSKTVTKINFDLTSQTLSLYWSKNGWNYHLSS